MKNSSPRIAFALMLPLLGAAYPVFAQDPAAAAPGAADVTVVGEVIDPSAYLKDGKHGIEMTEETYTAVDGGQSLAILETGTNNLYLLLAEQNGEDPNELVYDFVNQQVTAKGRVFEKGGIRGLVAASVEPVAAAASAAASSP